jgi:hypothetical protein
MENKIHPSQIMTRWTLFNENKIHRHKLGLAEPYSTENKIHPSQIRTRWTLFNGKQDSFVTN